MTGTPSAYQTGFFSSRGNESTDIGGFAPELLDYAYSIRQPSGVVEHQSSVVLYLDHPVAPLYTGPVQLVVGEFDWVVCLGDCNNTYNTSHVEQMFPKASDVDVYLQPGARHGLPFHRGAAQGFERYFDWVESEWGLRGLANGEA